MPPSPDRPGPSRDLALEGLRGFAALAVLGAHLLAPANRVDPAYAPAPFWGEFEFASGAVLLFFVLSGYVIGLTNAGRASGARVLSYLRRRFLRLMPINVLAVLLAWAVLPELAPEALLANLALLQHSTPVFGWVAPLLENNPNLWSLHYEVVYYLFFLLLWFRQPPLVLLALAFAAAMALRFAVPAAAFLGTYAAGACFWVGGWWIARRAAPAEADGQPWATLILLCSVTWQSPLTLTLTEAAGVNWPWVPEMAVWHLEYLPLSLWLVAAAAGRELPGQRAWRWAALTLPLAGLVAQALLVPTAAGTPVVYARLHLGLWLGALLLLCFRQRRSFWHPLAPVGAVSFAIYALSSPIQYWVSQQTWLPSGSPASYLARVAVILAAVAGAAWWSERWLQPRIVRLVPAPGGSRP